MTYVRGSITAFALEHQEERETRLNAEKEAKKFKMRTKFWKGSTVVLGLMAIGLYIFK